MDGQCSKSPCVVALTERNKFIRGLYDSCFSGSQGTIVGDPEFDYYRIGRLVWEWLPTCHLHRSSRHGLRLF